jgi:predicted SnoaL-like aldol condensation-catalyzing enzyme
VRVSREVVTAYPRTDWAHRVDIAVRQTYPIFVATESYIQHNPNVASGRDAMVTFMKGSRPVRDIAPTITFPVIAIMAEDDLVMVATVSYAPDPTAPGKKYAGTHFDMFRIENGKIAEHWDSVAKDPNALKFDPNTQNKP